MLKRFYIAALASAMLVGGFANAQTAAQRHEPQAAQQSATSRSGQQTTGQSTSAGQTDAQMQNRPSAERDGQTARSTQMGQTESGNGQVHYVTSNGPNIWRATKLDGVDVYNGQNEKIGAISDVLIDRSGKVEAVVIGVGGFLGLGERNVAVSFDALQWQVHSSGNSTSSTNTTGSTANANGSNRDYPAKAILPGATKDQLKNAPEFKYAS